VFLYPRAAARGERDARVVPVRVSRLYACDARVVPVCVRCACRARDARRERVRVIRFVPLGFPQKQNKKLIKTITYPSFTNYFGLMLKNYLTVTRKSLFLKTSKRQTLFRNSQGDREQPASLDTKRKLKDILPCKSY
jgi:hypothetical protein